MVDEGEWHSSLDGIAHSQGSLLSPEEQETWFSLALLPGCIHAHPPWSPFLPLPPGHAAGGLGIPSALPSKRATRGGSVGPTREALSYPGTATCPPDSTDNSCTILPLLYQSTVFSRQLRYLAAWIPFCSYAPRFKQLPHNLLFHLRLLFGCLCPFQPGMESCPSSQG